MAGFFPTSRNGGGLFFSEETPGWQNDLGALSALVVDAGAALSGRPERGGQLQAFNERQRTQEMQRGLYRGLTSDDPATREKAYTFAAMNGVDTSAFRKANAQKALPAFMSRLSQYRADPNRADGQSAITDALRDAPPELQEVYGPEVVKSLFEKPDNTPRTGRNPATGKMEQFVVQGGKPIWMGIEVTPEAPKTREVRIGSQIVTQEYQPDGTWREIGRGAAFKPDSDTSAGRGVVIGNSLVNPYNGQPIYTAPKKPLPASLQKEETSDIEAIQTAKAISKDLSVVRGQLEKGDLTLTPAAVYGGAFLNTIGQSNENSRRIGTFKAQLEKLRNDSLRLNKGVQTDGDAQRAWNELFANINDGKLVQERLAEIEGINARAAELKAQAIDLRRANFGLDPFDASQINPRDVLGTAGTTGASSAAPQRRTDPRTLPQKPATQGKPKTVNFSDLP